MQYEATIAHLESEKVALMNQVGKVETEVDELCNDIDDLSRAKEEAEIRAAGLQKQLDDLTGLQKGPARSVRDAGQLPLVQLGFADSQFQ